MVRRASVGPGGTATVAGFRDDEEVRAALIALTEVALEVAIVDRLWRQAVSDRGDAAATMFLDAQRVHALLHGPGAPAPPKLAQLQEQVHARRMSLVRRLEATRATTAGPRLAIAFHRWQLAPEAVTILAHLVAIELSPRLARLAAFAGGDASRPVVVEGFAALLGPDAAGTAALGRELAPGAPLHDLGLVVVRAPELPWLKRPIGVGAGVLDLAFGAAPLPQRHGATPLAVPQGAFATGEDRDAVRERIRAVARRPAPPVIGAVRTAADLPVLARLLADDGMPLLVTELSNLAEDGRLTAIARDAAVLGAAIAIRVDTRASDDVRAARAIDRLAALAPVFVAGGGEGNPVAAASAGRIPIDLAVPAVRELGEAIAGAFAEVITSDEAHRVAASATFDLAAIVRAHAAIAAQPLPRDLGAAVERALTDQVAPTTARAIDVHAAPASLRATVEDIAARWAACATPRRLRVMIDGRAGVGKTTLAAAIADRLGMRAYALDPARAQRFTSEPALAGIHAAVAANAAALVVENADLLGTRRRGGADQGFAMGELARVDGLIIVTTRDAVANIEPSLRRELDATVTVPFPEHAERRRLWALGAARRGWEVPPGDLDRLAHDITFGPAQIALVIGQAAAPTTLHDDARHRSLLIAGIVDGVEVD